MKSKLDLKHLRLTIIVFAFTLVSFSTQAQEKIKWLSWEEAIALNEENPKKILVDVYTNWCGWCKRMDTSTFSETEIIEYINTNYYAVKLNAEQKEDINYKGHQFKYDPTKSRRGTHELAVALLDGNMSYPAFVFLNADEQKITLLKGYQAATDFIVVLKYIGEEKYKTSTFEDYKKETSNKK
ncbi:thioredoxin family protein [Pontimicrobium sp. IMCC45349]|uniref:thioredoxin family protein n=1 Tax=Pontimicrobium sp. IMCC45349 TaxID=3391574 RepID=UPI0039A12CC2